MKSPRRSSAGGASRCAAVWAELSIPSDYAIRRHLPLQIEATSLVSIGSNPDGREVQLAPLAAESWTKMHACAARDEITLLPLSGFRSVARQAEIIREKLAGGNSIEDILRSVAAPGCSEHHTGRALDIGAPDEPAFEEAFAHTSAFAWLTKHAAEFGFRLSYPRNNPHGIVYEPWHWCWHNS